MLLIGFDAGDRDFIVLCELIVPDQNAAIGADERFGRLFFRVGQQDEAVKYFIVIQPFNNAVNVLDGSHMKEALCDKALGVGGLHRLNDFLFCAHVSFV